MSQSEIIDLILIGKSGNGSSATGNSIIGRKVFQENASGSPSVNREPEVHSSVTENKTVRVVDGLDLGVTDKSIFDRQLDKAMRLVNNGFSALLIVVRFDVPFSKEEVTGLKILKECLGQNIIRDFGICVVTHGDHFQVAEAETEVDSFEDWYTAQDGDFHRCFAEFRFRCVLFNNKTDSEDSREQQVKKLCHFATELSEYHFKICGKKKFENKRKMADKETKMYQESREPIIGSTSLAEEGEELLRETELRLTEIEKEIQKLLKEIQSFARKFPSGASEASYQKISEKFTHGVHDLQSKLQVTSGRINLTVEAEVQTVGPDDVNNALSDTASQNRSALVAADPAIPGWIKVKEPLDIDLLLIGKTGTGRSATGNSILRRKAFKSRSSISPTTKEVAYEVSEFQGRIIKVVDSPGVYDTSVDEEKAVILVLKAMEYAIAANPRGYHAFLLVTRYGGRFTAEDQDTIAFLKKIFGETFVRSYCILVLTCGDYFEAESEETGESFEDWCKEQEGVFAELMKECDNRIILFDNVTKDERKKCDQIEKLIQMVDNLRFQGYRYTDENFNKAKAARERLMIEAKKPRIQEETMMEANLIIQKIQELQLQDDLTVKIQLLEGLQIRAENLCQSISSQDLGTGALHDLCEKAKLTIDEEIEFCHRMLKERERINKQQEKLEERLRNR